VNLRYLPTYLNDHLAAATAVTNLSARAASSNKDSEYGEVLAELHREIAEDKATLEDIMDRLEIRKDHLKTTAAQVAELAGRLKPNAHLLSYSPLSRVVELETMALGVSGKLGLWRVLHSLASTEDRLNPAEFDVLIERAERQQETLETHRMRAARETFA